MKKITCQCKFCRRDIEMEVDERGFDNPLLDMKLWLFHIACARCATFYESKRKVTDAIGTACHILINARGDSKISTVIQEKLTTLTKRLCELTCDFKMAQFFWDVNFVMALMEKPALFSRTINLYSRRLNELLAETRQPHND